MSHDSHPEGSTSWREIAQRATKETDSQKLSYLVAEFCAMLEEEDEKKKMVNPLVPPKANGPSKGTP